MTCKPKCSLWNKELLLYMWICVSVNAYREELTPCLHTKSSDLSECLLFFQTHDMIVYHVVYHLSLLLLISSEIFYLFRVKQTLLSKLWSHPKVNQPVKPVTLGVFHFMGKSLCRGMVSPFSVFLKWGTSVFTSVLQTSTILFKSISFTKKKKLLCYIRKMPLLICILYLSHIKNKIKY